MSKAKETRFRLKWVKDLIAKDKQNGRVEIKVIDILIDKSLAGNDLAETVIHECIHASDYHINASITLTEEQVDDMANFIMFMLKKAGVLPHGHEKIV